MLKIVSIACAQQDIMASFGAQFLKSTFLKGYSLKLCIIVSHPTQLKIIMAIVFSYYTLGQSIVA